MWKLEILLMLFILRSISSSIDGSSYYSSPSRYVFWPNATIPFYIHPEHFDHEQSLAIMSTLAIFAFRTCLKFVPVLMLPGDGQHVMVFENPRGIRKCVLDSTGHPREEPHRITLGYDCLRPPQIDMVVMKALGFPFEHNRHSRDIYVDVQQENIEPSAVQFFTKDSELPMELQSLPYDIDSVMHFGEREYSKNGHRTIIFKDSNRSQNRVSLTSTDLKKIEIVYGSECRNRDRQEKIELCQRYPGVARKKRDIVSYRNNANLRVNRDITPPPNETIEIANNSLIELGIETEVQEIVDQVYKVSSKALLNARAKFCNLNKTALRISEEKPLNNSPKPDVLDIIQSISAYAKNMVDNAVANLTEFCKASEDIERYQRGARCPFFGGRPCPETYRSTKSGAVKYSTQHRPVYYQSTKNVGGRFRNKPFDPLRSSNNTNVTADSKSRRKRKVDDEGTTLYMTDVTEDVNKNGQEANSDRENDKRDIDTTIVEIQDNDRNKRSAGTTTGNNGVIGNSTDVERTTDATDQSKSALRTATEIPIKDKQNRFMRGQRRRFKVTRSSGESDWDDSNLSSERTTKRERKLRQRPRILERDDTINIDRHNRQRNRLKPRMPLTDSQDDNENIPITRVTLSKKNEEFYNERKWPNGVVRYIIQEYPNYDTSEVRNRIEEVNDILKRKTCVSLQEITENEANKYEDYLVIDTGADFVTGRVGGRQNFGCLELFHGGQHRQHGAMMVMAMLGFYFEIARHDRDKYIRVHLRHVRPDKLHHFEKIRSDATLPLPYDYESATQPAWQFWRKVGKKGISTVATYKSQDPEGEIMKQMGQNSQLLSHLDLIKINSVYGTRCFSKARFGQTDEKYRRNF